MKNDYITVFDLKAGLPKAQLAPFNTTPLHGIAISGLESLAHDLGYSVLSPFGFPGRGGSLPTSSSKKSDFLLTPKVKNKYRSVKEARGMPSQLIGTREEQQERRKRDEGTPVDPPFIDEGIIYEDPIDESSPNYTLYVIAGFLTIGAIGFGMYHIQNKKKSKRKDREVNRFQTP